MKLFKVILDNFNEVVGARRNAQLCERITSLDAWLCPTNIKSFLSFYYQLGDDASREVMDLLIRNTLAAFMGADQSQFPFYDAQKWHEIETKAVSLDCFAKSYLLDKIETFILEGYTYKGLVGVDKGDHVLDCGAYTGNTALYFSRRAGATGRIYSFEPNPSTYSELKSNIEKCGMGTISCHNYAISKSSGEIFFDSGRGPGARIAPHGESLPALAIDDFVRENQLPKLDFIKMDIEGAELDALAGAVNSIKSFHPKLAICVYHKPDDLITIPAAIRDIAPGYTFFLRHNSNSFHETVLFGKYSDAVRKPDPPNPDESALIAEWWSNIRQIRTESTTHERRHLLTMYNTVLGNFIKWPIEPVWDQNYNWAYYPLSEDCSLHYEFLLKGSSVAICLHFEGEYSKYAPILEEICASSDLIRPLEYNKSGCSYLLKESHDYTLAARLMNHLVRLSWPILKKRRLLAEHLALFEAL